jgi:hypothetical protein
MDGGFSIRRNVMNLLKNLSARRSIGHKSQSSPTNLNDVLLFLGRATPTQLKAIRIAMQGKEARHGR